MVESIEQKDGVSGSLGTLNGKMVLLPFQQDESLGRRFWEHPPWAGGDCLSTIGFDQEQKRKHDRWQEWQEKRNKIL